MKAYVKINDMEIPMKDIAYMFGIKEPIYKVSVCQEVPAGTLVATATGMMTGPYPGINVDLVLPKEAESEPIGIACFEQPHAHGVPENVRAYLYGRGDDYVAYMNIDTRPDAIEEEQPLAPSIVISGNPGEVVRIWEENIFCEYAGRPNAN